MKSIGDILKANREKDDILTADLIDTLDEREEYIKDGDIYCKNCHTRRTCFGFTRKVRCICKCQAEQREKEAEEEKRKMRQNRVKKLKDASLLGERYKDTTFATTDVYSPDFELVFNRCRKYCEVADQVLNRGIGIYLFGESGVGKSHLTACMANELMNEYYTVLFTSVAKISEAIRGTFRSKKGETEQAFMERLAGIDFLFIDDIGTELVTKGDEDLWLQEKLFEVVNDRYNNKKPTIYTSNFSLGKLGSERGVAKKTIDRIAESTERIQLKGTNYRAKAKEKSIF